MVIHMHKKNRAFTLLEVLIAALILSLIGIGMANLFISGKRYVQHSRERMAGGELGKTFLDPLANDFVREDLWNDPSNCLTSNPSTGCPGSQTIGNITYNPTYSISDVTGTDLRRVSIDINWREASP